MIQFKAKRDTNPGKLASAIAYNIKNSDIEVLSMGSSSLDAVITALIIAKGYVRNQEFNLKFDFFTYKEKLEDETEISIIKTVISKEDK